MKTINTITRVILLYFVFGFFGCSEAPNKILDEAQSEDLNEWLAKEVSQREALESLAFAKKGLTKDQAANAIDLLFADQQKRMIVRYGLQWDNRLLKYDSYEMPFYYNIFGDEPTDGRSLFISLHGGGGVEASQNDQQYNNQKHLYDEIMGRIDGVYLAPRAPTNTWNLWHQDHIDDFIDIVIQMAVIKLNVNPNKIYLLGYSAGGDGVYQLAPRLADRLSAASAMAGHPNNASPLSLRNLPFTIHVGALDTLFDRNLIAMQWGEDLDDLQRNDPQRSDPNAHVYIHNVQIHNALGHWMELRDAAALHWMNEFQRKPLPEEVVWKQSDRVHNSFYWLGAPKAKNSDKIIASYSTALNEINIIENSSEIIELFLNDEMLNLDKPISIKYQGSEIYNKIFSRSILNIYQNLNRKGDTYFSFPCVVSVINNTEVLD